MTSSCINMYICATSQVRRFTSFQAREPIKYAKRMRLEFATHQKVHHEFDSRNLKTQSETQFTIASPNFQYQHQRTLMHPNTPCLLGKLVDSNLDTPASDRSIQSRCISCTRSTPMECASTHSRRLPAERLLNLRILLDSRQMTNTRDIVLP
jgi:hypothetical protein